MLNAFYNNMVTSKEVEAAFWIDVIAPTREDINYLSQRFNLNADNIESAIDPEEKNRIESYEDYIFILFDIPIKKQHRKKDLYKTIPLGIICTTNKIITICSEDNPIIGKFKCDQNNFKCDNPFSFMCKIMLEAIANYQIALTIIDKKRIEFEEKIERIKEEDDIISLHSFESTLVYFTTSLQGNNNVLHKLLKLDFFKNENHEIINDVMVENQQAIEMTQIYREILDGTRELVSSIINLRLNKVMKRLTSITLILSIPMVISGMYGMNVDSQWMPFSQAVHGFGIIGIITIITCLALILILKRKNML